MLLAPQRKIIQERSKGNPTIAFTTETKLVLKGINPDKWNDTSEDDPVVIDKLKQIGSEFGIRLY
jgi:hypothetical protein